MSAEAVFVAANGRFVATEFARGPWDPRAQHGGAPAALLMRAFERHDGDPGLRIARVTYELLQPVPLGELEVTCTVLRPGHRVQVLEGSISTAKGTEVVRARALCVLAATIDAGSTVAAPPGPEQIETAKLGRWNETTFPGDAMELRFVSGEFGEPGPATAWFRLRVPLVAGEEPSGLQRLAAASDFPNGIASVISWDDYLFINPDLTIYIERIPVGEWIALDAQMRVAAGGVGVSEAVLYDARGRVGRSLQSLYVAPRDAPRRATSGGTP